MSPEIDEPEEIGSQPPDSIAEEAASDDPGADHPATGSAGTDDSGGDSSGGDAATAEDEAACQHIGASSGLDRKRTIIGAVVAVVFLSIVFSRVIPQIGDYSAAVDSLQTMTKMSLITLVLVVLWYLFVYGWPFVAATPGLRYKQGFIVNQSAFAVSNGIPGGGAFGLGLQYAQLTSYKASPTASTAAIGATGVWSVFITLFLPITGIAALAASGDDTSGYMTAAILGFAALVAVVVVFALILRSERLATKIGGFADKVVNWILSKFKRGWHVDMTNTVLSLRHDIVNLVRRRWHVITLAQIAVSWSQFAILYTALLAVGGDSGTVTLLAAYGAWAISQIGIMIPITPGGLGTVDAALIALLQSVGADVGDATAAALVWRASSYVPQMVIGLISIFYWRWEESKRRKAEEAVAAQDHDLEK